MFCIGLYRDKHGKTFLSETIRPRALIFVMQNDLLDLYQVCSNYAPRAKIGPTPGVTTDMASVQQIPICKEKHEQIFLSKTTRPRALILGMKHHLVNPYQLCSNNPLGHMFYIGLYRENMKKSSCLKSYVLEPWYIVSSITLRSSTLFVQIMPLGPKIKNGPAPGSHVLHSLI